MIISRTPLRISFVGGGSDIPSYYREHGGAVVSTAIDKFVYVNVNRKFDNGIRVAYSKTEEVEEIGQVEHRLVRAALQQLGIQGGVEITTIADIPSKGTGLGSSSSFVVGLLHALNAFKSVYVSREDLGRQSCNIEIDICGAPIGKQDQYAAAYGGLNLMEFLPDERVVVSPIITRQETIVKLEHNLLLMYTGITRNASDVLRRQSDDMARDRSKTGVMRRMVELAYQCQGALQRDDVASFGEILHENWMLKRSISNGISTLQIDDYYDIALAAGATGGKILGAGAGGFLLLYAPADRHDHIKFMLRNLRPIPFSFEKFGSQIIFYQ